MGSCDPAAFGALILSLLSREKAPSEKFGQISSYMENAWVSFLENWVGAKTGAAYGRRGEGASNASWEGRPLPNPGATHTQAHTHRPTHRNKHRHTHTDTHKHTHRHTHTQAYPITHTGTHKHIGTHIGTRKHGLVSPPRTGRKEALRPASPSRALPAGRRPQGVNKSERFPHTLRQPVRPPSC